MGMSTGRTAAVASHGGAGPGRGSCREKAASWAEPQTGCDKNSRMQEG